ncbi:hypothetical protein GGF41_008579 [Coemansia sp. RSA 2531]|nr:hypothetical protein GGF41_008579 [Coemansia sp. RSA 2531]
MSTRRWKYVVTANSLPFPTMSLSDNPLDGKGTRVPILRGLAITPSTKVGAVSARDWDNPGWAVTNFLKSEDMSRSSRNPSNSLGSSWPDSSLKSYFLCASSCLSSDGGSNYLVIFSDVIFLQL